MKNKLIIDFDSEREDRFIFTKPQEEDESVKQMTHDEAKEMLLLDIGCLSEAITRLILIAHNNGYTSKDDLIFATVNTIYQGLHVDNNQKSIENNQ